MLRLFKILQGYVKPDAVVDHCLVHKLGAETTLDFRKPEKKKKHIKYNNNSGLPVKMILKAIRIAWDFFEPSL